MKLFKKLACFLVTAALLLSVLAIPALAMMSGSEGGYIWGKVSNDPSRNRTLNRTKQFEGVEQDVFKPNDTVRVSILLEKPATLDRYGFRNSKAVVANQSAMAYRANLLKEQQSLTSRIEKTALNGKKLDVVWNLTLAANIISANVLYKQIADIEKVPGVSAVYVENEYSLDGVADVEESPTQTVGTVMTNTPYVWANGYTGAGSLIAVVDTGLDTTHISFDEDAFLYAIDEDIENGADVELLTEEKLADLLPQLNIATRNSNISASDLYLSAKIPFAFNYSENNLNVGHLYDRQSEHGSHVTGIAAANRYVPDGNGGFADAWDSVKVQGQAPDAQVVVIKYFSARTGTDADYFAAIEDCILMGVDAVNLSLSTSQVAGLSINRVYEKILKKIEDSDLTMVCSAGNNGKWTTYLGIFGYLYSEDKNLSTAGSPGNYPTSLMVASVDNDGKTGNGFTYEDTLILVTETAGYGNEPFTTLAGTHDFVYLDSVGTADEFAAIADKVAGNIAICNRGETSFFEKVNAAVESGAIGVIIANNQAGSINMNLTGYKYNAPAVSILLADAQYIKETAEKGTEGAITYYTGSLTISDEIGSVMFNSPYYTLSSFSSWGTPGNLILKPEITAPGGGIYSVAGTYQDQTGAIKGGFDQYENMSGTSMSAPQITGLVGTLAQYIRENDLKERTGLSERAIAQSLLMSTAYPMVQDDGTYYSLMGQGAGLADIAAATNATSLIIMGEDATASAKDGKVKAEIGAIDEPNFSFTFTVQNFSDLEQKYHLDADFFTQYIFNYYVYDANSKPIGITSYMDDYTDFLESAVSWKINGEDYEPEGSLIYDFNDDGTAAYNDIQVILDYATGLIEEFANMEYADLNEDGNIDSYDAYLALAAINEANLTLAGGESAEIEISVELLNIDDYSDKGAYIEGFVYVCEADTEDGAIGVEHSIPVFGFYGDWTESSMFDHGSAIDTYYGTGDLPPYMQQVLGEAANYVKAFLSTYPGDDVAYEMLGNPVLIDVDGDGNPIYRAERAAMNATAELTGVRYTQIRNAANGMIIIENQDGEILFGGFTGAQYAAHRPDGAEDWLRPYTTLNLGYTPGDDVKDGDVLTASVTLAPEYYDTGDGTIAWDELGPGATYSYSFLIDSTSPVIDAIDMHYDTKKGGFDRLDITATDNQYIAGVFVSTESGEDYGYFGSETSDVEAGTTGHYSVDFTGLIEEGLIDSLAEIEKHLLVEVYDYAGNLSTYKINLNPEELNQEPVLTMSEDFIRLHKNDTEKLSVTVEPWGYDETVIWTSSDDTVATVDANGVVKAIAPGDAVITATSAVDENVYAECAVEVFVIDNTLVGLIQDEVGYPYLFDWNLSEDETWNPIASLDTSVLNATMDLIGGYIYVQDFDGYIVKVDPDTMETVEVSAGTSAFGAPMDGLAMPHYYNLTNGTTTAFGIYGGYLLESENIMDNTFNTGYNLATYLNRYTKASAFVAVGWAGPSEDGGDTIVALDNKGYLWLLTYSLEGSLGLGYMPTLFKERAVDYEDTYMNSIAMDTDGELYLSWFNGSTNVFYQLPYDSQTGTLGVLKLGDVGPDVWPAILLNVLPNSEPEPEPEPGAGGGEGSGRISDVPAWYPEGNVVAEGLKAEPVRLSWKTGIELGQIAGPTKAFKRQDEDFTPLTPNSTNLGLIAVQINADEDAYNGQFMVEYDPEALELMLGTSFLEYYSPNIGDGVLEFAYVDSIGVKAGDSLVTLGFVPVDDVTYTEIKVTYKQINDQYPEEAEIFQIGTPAPHEHVLPEEAEWTWSDDHSFATATIVCEDCGEVIVLPAVVDAETTDASYEAAGKTVYTATATILDKTYTDTFEEEIPALEYTYGEPFVLWAEDYSAKICVERNDGEILELETSVESETVPATHTVPGTTVYTASVEFNGQGCSFILEVDIEPLGHTFGEPTWIWSDDLTLAAAVFTCDCGEEGSTVTVVASVSKEVGSDIETATATVTFNDETFTDVKTREVEQPSGTAVFIVIDSVNGTQVGDISVYFYGEGAETISDRTSVLEEIDYMLGDISGNGEIDAADYLMARRNVLGTLDFSNDQFKRGDVNRNEEIEILDYTMIKQHVLGTFTIQQPEPTLIPGPDFSDNILICVDENGLVKSVNAEAGVDKSGTEIPEFGYILSIPIDKFAEEPLQHLKENVGMKLAGINAEDYRDAGLDVALEDSAIASYTYFED